MKRILSRTGQYLLFAASLVLMFYEIFMPESLIGQFANKTMILPLVGFMSIGLIEIRMRKGTSAEANMTLEAFYAQEKTRFKSLMFGTGLYLAVMIPMGFYGSGQDLYFSVIISMMLMGAVASWVALSEIKKAVKNSKEGKSAA